MNQTTSDWIMSTIDPCDYEDQPRPVIKDIAQTAIDNWKPPSKETKLLPKPIRKKND